MIKINLLPFRIARKKEYIRKHIFIFLLLIFLTILVFSLYTIIINNKISGYQASITHVNRQIAKYKKKADQVVKIKKDLKILKEKLEIISSLKQQRKKQLILFDTMTELVISTRMRLTSFKTKQNTVTIKGIAFDNPTIADFMGKLEQSSLFSTIDLKTAKMEKFNNDVMLKSFELLCVKEKSNQAQND